MRAVTVIAVAVVLITLSVAPVWAHQPYFEEEDIIADAPLQVKDPTVSTAVYATLESSADVDYYTFGGRKGQSILLEITIPQIAGQELFAPEMALLGPGLAADRLPARVDGIPSAGSLLIPALTGPAAVFNEPFSRTSYWERQSQRVTLPADGRYIVAVWHGAGEVGRYVFVVGDTAASNAWNGQPVPGLAPAAKQGGDFVGRVIGARVLGKRPPERFVYRHLGSLATIGRKAAVVDFGFLKLRGATAWWFWGAVHVALLVGVRNRASVMLDWFWAYLTFRSGTRLITGGPAEEKTSTVGTRTDSVSPPLQVSPVPKLFPVTR